jgi:hypothetical protein
VGVGNEIPDLISGESPGHRQMGKSLQLHSAAIIIREMKKEGIHPPLSHEIKEVVIIFLWFKQTGTVYVNTINLHFKNVVDDEINRIKNLMVVKPKLGL